MRKNYLLIIGFFLVGLVVGLASYSIYTNASAQKPAEQLTLDASYTAAIKDAMVAEQSEVSTGLTAITADNSNLLWQDGKVLVVTWTKYASSYPENTSVTNSWGDTWVTIAPQIQTFFKNNVSPDTNTTIRTAQLLGMPANTTNAYFVELWVNPQSLFRPAPDNEITDTTATLSFPANATADYKAWFDSNIIYSYYPMKYPWTRLGYTYDWGSTNHVGLSEFILKENATATVKSVTPTEEYLQR